MLHGHFLVAVLTCHALARENTTRVGVSRRTARFAHVVRTVRARTAVEAVALDGTGEAVTLGNAGDVHHLSIGEVSSTEFLANRPGFEISDVKFGEVFADSDFSLLEMADFCLVGTLFLLETKADLDSLVAILFYAPEGTMCQKISEVLGIASCSEYA